MSLSKEAISLLLAKASEAVVTPLPQVPGRPVAVVQSDFRIENLEAFLEAPTRTRQNVILQSPAAFADYVDRFKTESTVIFVGSNEFVAKLDYHGPGAPSWCSHVAKYAPRHSHQWQEWAKQNKKPMDQLTFADFLEERIVDIDSPNGGVVLTAVLNFKENVGMTLESAKDLRNGTSEFRFVKQGNPSGMTFPHELVLSIPVYEYHPHTVLNVELRYRTIENALLLHLRFVRDLADIVREEFEAVLEKVRDDLPQIPFYEGSAT